MYVIVFGGSKWEFTYLQLRYNFSQFYIHQSFKIIRTFMR